MEELRSTEILDREIQTDARRKAEQILRKAEISCDGILNSVGKDIEKAEAEKRKFYSQKLSAFKKDLDASVPLEKERFEVFFVQNSLNESMNEYLKSLPEEKRLELAMSGIDRWADSMSGRKFNAYVYGFGMEKAMTALRARFGDDVVSCSETKFDGIVLEDGCGLELKEGIILESDDRQFRCRLTVPEVLSRVLDVNRKELSDALFGGSHD